MKVSVIIPCFNEEKYIGACLESLTKQSVKPDEIIICDNNSTDTSIKVINSYKNKLPLTIVTEKTKGIIPALQKAYVSTKGDYILRTDADTVVPKDWVKNIISRFESTPEIDALGGYIYPIEDIPFKPFFTRMVFGLFDAYYLTVHGSKLLIGANTAFRRSSLDSIDGYLSGKHTAPEDIMMCFKMKDQCLKTERYFDCYNYASLRRLKNDPKELIYTILSSTGNSKFYHEKSI